MKSSFIRARFAMLLPVAAGALAIAIASCGSTAEAPDAAGPDVLPDADVDAFDVRPTDDATASCRSDRECSASGQLCDRATGSCVDCVLSTDCDAGEVCVGRTCMALQPCTSSRQCPGRVCAPLLGYCVDCNEDVDCGDASVCREHVCVSRPEACASSRECSSLGLVCDTGLGGCVECITGADCLDTELLCDRTDPVLGGRCVPRICSPGTTECAGTYDARTCSDDGSSWESHPCGPGESCAAGRCTPWLCEPGSSRCLDDTRRVLCDDEGRAETEAPCTSSTSCSAGECRPWLCTPGTASCTGPLTRRTCDANGLGYTAEDCPGSMGCNDLTGTCERQICTPSSASCGDIVTRRSCDANGLAYTSTSCGGSESCAAGACVARVCTPGTASCDGASRSRICSPDGLAYSTTDCAPSSSCSGGVCSGWACTPGATECVDVATRRFCADDGLSWVAVACGSTATCAAGVCRTHICEPGSISCEDSVTRRACAADGLSYVNTPCHASESCNAGVCARTTYGDLVRRDGAIAFWPLDDVSAGRTADVIGGRDAVVMGAVDFSTAPLHLDSEGSIQTSGAGYLEVPYASVFQSAPFSVELWFRRDAAQHFAFLTSCRDSGAFGWDLFVHESLGDVLEFELGTTAGWVHAPGMVPALGDVIHVVGTYDGATARLYWNGTLVSGMPAVLAPSTRPLRIAAATTTVGDPSGHAAGTFDDVAFYPRALTPVEVAEHAGYRAP